MYKAASMKGVLIYLLGAVIVAAAIFVYLFFAPILQPGYFLERLPHQ